RAPAVLDDAQRARLPRAPQQAGHRERADQDRDREHREEPGHCERFQRAERDALDEAGDQPARARGARGRRQPSRVCLDGNTHAVALNFTRDGRRWHRLAMTSFAVFRSRRMVVLFVLGFSSGIPYYLTSQTLQAWMTAVGIDYGSISAFASVGLPYTLKFAWAPLLDRFPLPMLGPPPRWVLPLHLLPPLS